MFERRYSKPEAVLLAGRFLAKTVQVIGFGIYLVGKGGALIFKGGLWLSGKVSDCTEKLSSREKESDK